jgi:hypothetical protein
MFTSSWKGVGKLDRDGKERPVWVEQAEDIVRGIKGVSGAKVLMQDGEISEIHVSVASGGAPARAPKRYVRDIESALLVKLGRRIDHKKISIVEDISSEEGPERGFEGNGAVRGGARIRISSVNLHAERLEAHAQVILAFGTVEALGTAVGPSTRLNKYRLMANATLNAVSHFVAEDCSFNLGDVSVVGIGRENVVLVTVDFLSTSEERVVCGSCIAKEDDVLYSVVCASLNAVNRIFEGLRTKEPLEYEIEPE